MKLPENANGHKQAVEKWEANGSPGARPGALLGPGHAHEPTTLYNAMIAPLTKYTIKGALWYQGETEAGRAQGDIYGEALMTLVRDWRRAFGQGDGRQSGQRVGTAAIDFPNGRTRRSAVRFSRHRSKTEEIGGFCDRWIIYG